MLFTLKKITLVNWIILIILFSFSMLKTIQPFSNIFSFRICTLVNSLSSRFVIYPFSFIIIPIWIYKSAITTSITVFPLSLIVKALLIEHNSFSLLLIVVSLPNICPCLFFYYFFIELIFDKWFFVFIDLFNIGVL